MAKVILICGRICSGKTTYAQRLRSENRAVLLSCDEITLALFRQDIGDMHDTYVERLQEYLFQKSLELIDSGIDVILDWGFWMREERDYARDFYASRNIPFELHAIDISEKEWQARLDRRNADVLAGKTSAYYVDEGLAAKFASLYEAPDAGEIHVWVR